VGATAELKFTRISAQKMRLVADLVRGKKLDEALSVLRFTKKKGAPVLAKLLKSAAANAEETTNFDMDGLYIAKILVDKGPFLKRFCPAPRGRALPIKKRTAHIFVELSSTATRKKRK